MSRSKRKPYFTDQQNCSTKFTKRRASRRVRDLYLDQVPQSGSNYKKESNSYDIRDWSFHSPTNKKAYRK